MEHVLSRDPVDTPVVDATAEKPSAKAQVDVGLGGGVLISIVISGIAATEPGNKNSQLVQQRLSIGWRELHRMGERAFSVMFGWAPRWGAGAFQYPQAALEHCLRAAYFIIAPCGRYTPDWPQPVAGGHRR